MKDAVRLYVFSRDNWRCRACGRADTLDPHHVVFKSAGGRDIPSNLLTMCRHCHDSVHGGRLKIETVEIKEYDRVVKFWRQEGWRS